MNWKANISRVLGGRSAPVEHKYVFVISPNSSGSTLVCKILNRSSNTSFVNSKGTMEAQKLEEVARMFPKGSRWDRDLEVDWRRIKEIFLSQWDLNRPILVDKSPWFLPRVQDLQSIFDPSYFIFVVRNPYAVAESLMRRSGRSAQKSAEIVSMKLNFQRDNMEIGDAGRTLLVKYEELTDNPERVANNLLDMLPDLVDLPVSGSFAVHNVLGKHRLPIGNLNPEKIERLSRKDIMEMNKVFINDESLFDFFGYEFIEKPVAND